jgi:hypothetical protein
MKHARLALGLVALLILPASTQVGLSGSWKIEVIRPASVFHRAFESRSICIR